MPCRKCKAALTSRSQFCPDCATYNIYTSRKVNTKPRNIRFGNHTTTTRDKGN
jgi:hypothetical protein